jgi:uncharacterized protein YdeI (BOF family)
MRTCFYFVVISILSFLSPACKDQIRDEFPRIYFTGFFDLRDPRYSKTVFTASRDMDGNIVGINGIIVYRAGDQFYAFERMCPYV